MNSNVLGIDIGTSGLRVAIVDSQSEVVGMAATRFSALGTGPQDPVTWRLALETTLAELGTNNDLTKIAGLAVDGTSGTMLAVDASGEPVGPTIMYDEPCEDELILTQIAAYAPADSAALGRTSALARVRLMQDRPGVYKVIHQADWLTGLFSGRFDLSDENNALKTGYDPIQRRWPEWIVKAGADLKKLPHVYEPGSPIAKINSTAAQKFGLPDTTLVCAGTTDGCASFLATGAKDIGDAVTVLGSTLVIKILCNSPVSAPAYGVYSHRLGDYWLAGGASNTGGKVIEKLFAGEDLKALSAALQPDHSTGLHFYPLTQPGERFPVNDPQLLPKLEPRPAEQPRFFQAVLEGIAEVEALAYRRLNELGAPPIKSVRSIGGGASNLAWTQIRQQLIGAPFQPVLSQEACAGTALLALKGLTHV